MSEPLTKEDCDTLFRLIQSRAPLAAIPEFTDTAYRVAHYELGWIQATIEARDAKIAKLKALLREALSALTNADCPKEAFGIGSSDEGTQWYLVDELLARIDTILAQPAEPAGGEEE